MYQIVQIGDKEIPMLAMASCDLYYRQIFGDDPIRIQAGKDVSEGDMIELLERMGFVMAKFAELRSRKDMLKLGEDAFLDWMDQFERADYLNALGDIRLVYEGEKITTSKEKKQDAD